MNTKKILSIGTFLFATLSVSAQSHDDLLRFSEYNWGYGTARSAAMGGTFVSLGADLSSMMVNPAGLGMYRRSEIGISPSFTSLGMKSFYEGTHSDKNRNRFAVNNIGGAFNLYNSSGSLTSVTMGFAYNKLADYNINRDARGNSLLSISDYFAHEMNQSHIDPNHVENLIQNGGRDEYLPEMLAYQGYIIDYENGSYINRIHPDAENAYAAFSHLLESKGSTRQFDVAMGMNFSNKLYVGFGFGFQDLYYKAYDSYYEDIANNILDHENSLRDLEYVQRIDQTGSAWNFKLGAILRPVEELRLALAFHTPTYITMEWENRQQAFSRTGPNNNVWDNESSESILYDTYRARTPMRLMLGTSYTFFHTAILSIDYERTWYNQMKMFRGDWSREDQNMTNTVKNIYKPANNVRVGLETAVAPNWFTRFGFAYYGGMYQDHVLREGWPDFKNHKGQTLNYSTGFGYRTPGWSVDLAYIYMDRKDPPTYAYYSNAIASDAIPYRIDRQRHNVTATLSLRF